MVYIISRIHLRVHIEKFHNLKKKLIDYWYIYIYIYYFKNPFESHINNLFKRQKTTTLTQSNLSKKGTEGNLKMCPLLVAHYRQVQIICIIH